MKYGIKNAQGAVAMAVAAFFMAACSDNGGRKVVDNWNLTDAAGEKTVSVAEPVVSEGQRYTAEGDYTNFVLHGEAVTDSSSEAAVVFHNNGGNSGYEVLVRGGESDGSRKTGSLSAVRNLYRTPAPDGEWFGFTIAVRGKNISVAIDSVEVVCYTEPDKPFRLPEYSKRLLSGGKIALEGRKGSVRFRNITISRLDASAKNPSDTLPPVDEQTDGAIRLQQRNFPVIDYHVHLKGGLTADMAHAKEMNYGINYGISINIGEGGIGTMLPDDTAAVEYCDSMRNAPFLLGAQGEGRRWIVKFTEPVLDRFDYLFTDALTIMDKGRICRTYVPEEVRLDGRTKEQYMDMLVEQTVKILTNEPADFYANPTFLPDVMQDDYDGLWTDERIDRVLDVLQRHGMALEINSRYRIPSYHIIKRAKSRGIKFTFGTNNEKADFGRSEYAISAVEECGLQPSDIWFPSMSTRASRHAVDYNNLKSKANVPIETLR